MSLLRLLNQVGPTTGTETVDHVGDMLMTMVDYWVTLFVLGGVGLVCALVVPLVFAGDAGVGVIYGILYILCVKSRNMEVMRRTQWWTWNTVLHLVVSVVLIAISLLPKTSNRSLLGYLLVAVVVFCLVETAQPIFDYVLME